MQAVGCTAAEAGHCLHKLSRGPKLVPRAARGAARRMGGDAVDYPGSADRAHRIAHEGIQAGIVLVDLEIAAGILHQHFVLTRSAERAEADNVKVAADRSEI